MAATCLACWMEGIEWLTILAEMTVDVVWLETDVPEVGFLDMTGDDGRAMLRMNDFICSARGVGLSASGVDLKMT